MTTHDHDSRCCDTPHPALLADEGAFDPAAAQISRRTALRVLAVGTIAVGGLPVLLAGCGPTTPVAPTWVTLDIDPAALPIDEPREIPFELVVADGPYRGSAWVVRRSEAEIIAYSPLCPHRPCAYTWASDSERFLCICHDGVFDIDGTVISGPPPRPLDRFTTRIAGGTIEVEVLAPAGAKPAG
jgi:Rieske Fe-S protein